MISTLFDLRDLVFHDWLYHLFLCITTFIFAFKLKKERKIKNETNELNEKKELKETLRVKNDKYPLNHTLLGATLWGNTVTEKTCFYF